MAACLFLIGSSDCFHTIAAPDSVVTVGERENDFQYLEISVENDGD